MVLSDFASGCGTMSKKARDQEAAPKIAEKARIFAGGQRYKESMSHGKT